MILHNTKESQTLVLALQRVESDNNQITAEIFNEVMEKWALKTDFEQDVIGGVSDSKAFGSLLTVTDFKMYISNILTLSTLSSL